MFANLYDEKKAAQSAAYLLHRAQAPLTTVKLMKLLYLAERRSFKDHAEPLTGDRIVSTEQGPVLSQTYGHMFGELESVNGGWDSWVADQAAHLLSLRDNVRIDDPAAALLELSNANLDVLSGVWDEFGTFTPARLVDYTQSNCPEWTDPRGSMTPIPHERLLSALGYTNEQREALVERLRDQASLNEVFAATL
ncbi:Panacea domain-containing protein [Paraburkholderia acidicola]|uniref:Panacea domain-containing protein n=1 Tax=Paraburkholderia acidicola TaxID=1912599 RepID=A0ABV1LLI5_9BURK